MTGRFKYISKFYKNSLVILTLISVVFMFSGFVGIKDETTIEADFFQQLRPNINSTKYTTLQLIKAKDLYTKYQLLKESYSYHLIALSDYDTTVRVSFKVQNLSLFSFDIKEIKLPSPVYSNSNVVPPLFV